MLRKFLTSLTWGAAQCMRPHECLSPMRELHSSAGHRELDTEVHKALSQPSLPTLLARLATATLVATTSAKCKHNRRYLLLRPPSPYSASSSAASACPAMTCCARFFVSARTCKQQTLPMLHAARKHASLEPQPTATCEPLWRLLTV